MQERPKVYCLFIDEDNDKRTLVGVYSTEEFAKKGQQKYMKSYSFSIEEVILDEDFY